MSQGSTMTPWKGFAAFFAVFAVCIWVAIVFTESTPGRVVNAICGTLFGLVSVAFLVAERYAPPDPGPTADEEKQA